MKKAMCRTSCGIGRGNDLLEAIKAAPRFTQEAEISVESQPFFREAGHVLPRGGERVDWLVPGVIHRGGKGMIVAPPKGPVSQWRPLTLRSRSPVAFPGLA